MNAISANATGLSEVDILRAYVQEQQHLATKLDGLLEGIDALYHDNIAKNALTALIQVARATALELEGNLDCVSLPEGGAA